MSFAAAKNLMCQLQPVGTLALLPIGRYRRLPEIVVGIVMREGQRIRQRAAEAGDAGA
jgi:hypothetical protein